MTDSDLSSLQKARLYATYRYVSEPNWDVLRRFSDADFALRKREYAQMSEADLLKQMDIAAKAAFETAFSGITSEVAIPVSGGRDSRFILCMAREFGLNERVVTLTWGVPGGLDYEISETVSRALGFRHERICTTDETITFSNLRQAYKNGAHWTDLFSAHFNQAWRRYVPPGANAIIGYSGGPPIGCHYAPGHETLNFADSVAAFDAINRRRSRGPAMIGAVEDRLLPRDVISWPEQLDLVYRQEGYLRRIVAPGARVRTPFAQAEWQRTAYALPCAHRAGGALFTKFLVTRFPDAFEVGTSGAFGLHADTPQWRRRAQRRLMAARYAVTNLFRNRGFMTFGKYGDERDLLNTLQAADENDNAPPSYRRLLAQRRDLSHRDAEALRGRIMLACNLAFSREDTDISADIAAA